MIVSRWNFERVLISMANPFKWNRFSLSFPPSLTILTIFHRLCVISKFHDHLMWSYGLIFINTPYRLKFMNCWERKEVCTVRHNNIFSLPILQKKPIHGIYVFLFKILSMNNFIWPKTHRFIEFWVGNNSETKMSKSNSISEITFYLSPTYK